LVKRTAPTTLKLLGVGPIHAAQMLITAGQNIDRIHSETAFAHLCAADPIPASSGKTERHRLNPGGNRAANRTLYLIAIVRLRYCPRTRDYLARRTTDGKSKREIIRCLKRYIAREIYYTLRADLKNLAQTI
jgi:transposase